jgi:hypothetical protein
MRAGATKKEPRMNAEKRGSEGARRMRPLSPDTHPEVEKRLIEAYRRMSAAEKLQRVRELTQFVQQLALADIRRRYPEADEHECRMRLASRWIEPELMRRAYGWDPDKEGY